jgi:Abortive infection alpha
MNEIISHVAGQILDKEALDPLIRIAAGVASERAADLIGKERVENLKRVRDRVIDKLKGKKAEAPPLSVSLPLLEAARDESREELQDLWASLLAAASDPARRGQYRTEFVDIVKKMEPIDAAVLEKLVDHAEMRPSRREVIASRLQVTEDEVLLAFRNLAALDLVYPKIDNLHVPQQQPYLQALGRQLLKAIKG